MSTILKTLKKLEEDKQYLERELDLKELVLQEDHKPSTRKTFELSRNNSILLILFGLGIGLTMSWGLKSSPKNEVAKFPQEIPVIKQKVIDKKRSDLTVGIPLSNIPEQRQHYEEKIVDNFFKPPVEESAAPAQQTFRPVVEPEVLPKDINEIRKLIETAKLAVEQPEPFPYPSELASRGVSIPNLKVKGIIFFSAKSPSNHIFVSTSQSNNRKVRIGDTVQSATLLYIESNRVVFSYGGENVHLRIGE